MWHHHLAQGKHAALEAFAKLYIICLCCMADASSQLAYIL